MVFRISLKLILSQIPRVDTIITTCELLSIVYRKMLTIKRVRLDNS